MKQANNLFAQGDVILKRIDAIPADAKKQARKKGQPVIVTHSETGHHHIVAHPKAQMFAHPTNPLIGYLKLSAGSKLEHLRDFDTHETVEIEEAGCFEVRRQREFTPEGFRQVAD